MAKKSKKVEKETRRLMEGIADLVKKKGDRYKFKSKSKKVIKKVKKTCVHWIMRKGKEVPTVIHHPTKPGYWKCTICGAEFPVKPEKREAYENNCNTMLEAINQIQFWAVKLGGDAEDTKMFLRLKSDLGRFQKCSKHILKAIDKRSAMEANRKKSDMLSQFDSYSSFNYKA